MERTELSFWGYLDFKGRNSTELDMNLVILTQIVLSWNMPDNGSCRGGGNPVGNGRMAIRQFRMRERSFLEEWSAFWPLSSQKLLILGQLLHFYFGNASYICCSGNYFLPNVFNFLFNSSFFSIICIYLRGIVLEDINLNHSSFLFSNSLLFILDQLTFTPSFLHFFSLK